MTKRTVPGYKNADGVYEKLPVEKTVSSTVEPSDIIPANLSIDDLMRQGLENIYGIIRAIKVDVGSGAPSRETVMNLKDVMTMLRDLKKEERDLLDDLTDEELEKLAKSK